MSKNVLDNINRIKFLMEIKNIYETDEVELDEDEVNEEGEESTDTTTDTTTDTSSDTGSSITPWESGVARGPGNPITSAKREDKTTRGKGNPIGPTKWASGRTMGPTGKNYKV
jgi:hypothetical protein